MILKGLQRWNRYLIVFTDSPWGCKRTRREKNKEMCLSFIGKKPKQWKKMEAWSIRLTLVPKSQCLPDWRCYLTKLMYSSHTLFCSGALQRIFTLCPTNQRNKSRKKNQFEGSFESQERNQKYKTNADIRYYQLFSGNSPDIVPKGHFGTSDSPWMFRMRRLNQKSSENFK